MANMMINGYDVPELKTNNSGFSKWGFGKKNGKEYFVKELITPVYPTDRSALSPELFESRVKSCQDFENKYKELYIAINSASRGNLVRIEEFFRVGSRYYVVTEKVENFSISKDVITRFSDDKKYLLLKSIAHCFMCLHGAGVVHMDVKPNNFMIKQTKRGNCVARLIDFDAGFIVGNPRSEDDEIEGDLTYLAPEAFLEMAGQSVGITTKADIFSLGLVFHEFFCGKLPSYDASQYDYPFEVALEEGKLTPDMHLLNPQIGALIGQMLEAEPENRPDASQIMRRLIEISGSKTSETESYFTTANTGISSRFISTMRASSDVRTAASVVVEKIKSAEATAKKETKANPWFSNASDL